MISQTIIGWDLGKYKSHLVAMERETGKILQEGKIGNDSEEILGWLTGLPRPLRVIFEATGNWQAIYEILEEAVEEIQMAHPLQTKAIAHARIKTDAIDARTLAHLGRGDLVPQAWIPPKEVRDLKEILRHRSFLVVLQTKVKNRIHTYLSKTGTKVPEGFTDLFGKKGILFLKGVELRSPYRELIDQDLQLLEAIWNEVQEASKRIDQQAKKDPRVEWLLPLRGVGAYSAMLILAEVGDIHRFPSPRHLISYAGLCPSTYQSGEMLRHGRITKRGSKWLRWILIEAATRYKGVAGRLGRFYERMEKKKGSKVARVALAREILTSVYWCLKKGVVFKEDISGDSRRFSGELNP